MHAWALFIGLAAVFLGVSAIIIIGGAIGRERAQISASLESIEAISGPIPEGMKQAHYQPFNARVTRPLQAYLANVARTIAGVNWPRNTATRLDRAGNPTSWDPERVLAAKSTAAIALFLLVGGLVLVTRSPFQALVWGAGFGVLGFFLPDLLLLNKAQHRSDSIRNALPDSIDLLTVSVESGLAFDAAVGQVARNTDGPLADEFARVLKEIRIGSSRSQAMRSLAERTDVEDLRVFLNSMIQAEKLGIPIADVLRVQASEIRLKRTQRIEEKAMKLPVKLIFPVMFCIMPALFIVILGPAVMSIKDAFGS